MNPPTKNQMNDVTRYMMPMAFVVRSTRRADRRALDRLPDRPRRVTIGLGATVVTTASCGGTMLCSVCLGRRIVLFGRPGRRGVNCRPVRSRMDIGGNRAVAATVLTIKHPGPEGDDAGASAVASARRCCSNVPGSRCPAGGRRIRGHPARRGRPAVLLGPQRRAEPPDRPGLSMGRRCAPHQPSRCYAPLPAGVRRPARSSSPPTAGPDGDPGLGRACRTGQFRGRRRKPRPRANCLPAHDDPGRPQTTCGSSPAGSGVWLPDRFARDGGLSVGDRSLSPATAGSTSTASASSRSPSPCRSRRSTPSARQRRRPVPGAHRRLYEGEPGQEFSNRPIAAGARRRGHVHRHAACDQGPGEPGHRLRARRPRHGRHEGERLATA